MYGEYYSLLRDMVRTPSLSYEEDKVAEVIAGALERMGITFQRPGGNIVALNRRYDPTRKTLALDAHIDTVPVNNGYTRDPFDPGNEPGTIWGLGSNDDGGSVVSMIAAFRHFYDRDMPVNLMLCLTREEEKSGPDGARYLHQSGGLVENGLPTPEWVIVGEPTSNHAATSEHGLLVLDGEASGVSAHAARGGGVNALYIALEDIDRLRRHVFDRVSPVMGKVRLNVTQISAGTAHNVIPDRCSFVVDIRPTELYTNEEILSDLRKECRSTLEARNLLNRSSSTRPDSPLSRTAVSLGIPVFSSPTTSDWMRIGCDAIKMGPGDSTRSHKADEYILEAEIAAGIEQYIGYIEAFYGNFME